MKKEYKMADATRVATVSIPMWALIVSLAIGTSAGTWAISAEAHNYRLQNITTRIGTHETEIMLLRDADTESKLERAANRIGIEQITASLDEIKGDVKTLLSHQ